MAFLPGSWVELHDGRVARVIEVDDGAGMILAATPAGTPVDRPISFADARWRQLDESGYRVQQATDPARMRTLADKEPVDLIVAILADGGGSAKVRDFRAALIPNPIPAPMFDAWWKRVQKRLSSDARIDASGTREGIYRLTTASGPRTGGRPPAIRTERRGGRLLADGRLLAHARSLVTEGSDLSDDDLQLVREEASLAERRDLDPTDRLLAFDLAVRLGLRQEGAAGAAIGDDLVRVDLLRIRDKDTKQRALRWATAYVQAAPLARRAELAVIARPLLRSAGALADEWDAPALALADELGVAREVVYSGRLGWGVPGTEAAGPPKYPDDLDAIERRIARSKADAMAGEREVAVGTALGALEALNTLHESPAYLARWKRLMDDLAGVIWASKISLEELLHRSRDDAGHLRPEAVAALVRLASGDGIRQVGDPLTRWFREAPPVYLNVLRDYAAKAGLDELRIIIDAARAEVAASTAGRLAVIAFDLAQKEKRDDDVARVGANLAGALASDDRGIKEALAVRGKDAAERLIEHDPPEGEMWFSAEGWRAFAETLIEELDRRGQAVDAAAAREELLTSELKRFQTALTMREEALSSTRAENSTNERGSAARVATNALRPVAKALADTYESNSLAALRDVLISVLRRAKIEQIGNPNDLVTFDPSRHQWVGSGIAADVGQVLSPGFSVHEEGGDSEIVLVPARVVDRPT